MTRRTIKPLSAYSRAVLADVEREWKLSRLERRYVEQGLLNLDEALRCEAEAEKEGRTLEDRNGRRYLHPLLKWMQPQRFPSCCLP